MPVIVVGADTDTGRAIANGLWSPSREVRVFVTDPHAGADFKERGFKVAIGDVSDASHVEGASIHCFTAVFVTEAARDSRDRSFADSEDAVTSGWAAAAAASDVKRVVWVTRTRPPNTSAPEVSQVDPSADDFVGQVVAFDAAHWAG